MREKKFGRLFLTWLLAATMVLTLLPVGMLAADAPDGAAEDGEVVLAPVAGVEEEEAAPVEAAPMLLAAPAAADTPIDVPEGELDFANGVIKGIKKGWLDQNKDKPLSVTIPAEIDDTPVTSIGQNAFKARNAGLENHPQVAAVDFSNATNLEKIDNQAFQYSPVTSVNLSKTRVTTIGKFAFGYCTSLENVILPNTLTVLGSSVFTDCKHVESIRLANSPEGVVFALPENLTSIGYQCFKNCFAADVNAKVVIPASVTTINGEAFKDIHITQIIFEKIVDPWYNENYSGYDDSAMTPPSGCDRIIVLPNNECFVAYSEQVRYGSNLQKICTYPIKIKFSPLGTQEQHLNHALLGWAYNSTTKLWDFNNNYKLPDTNGATSGNERPGYEYVGGWKLRSCEQVLNENEKLEAKDNSSDTATVSGEYKLANPTISYLVDGESKPVDADQPFTVTIGDGKEHSIGIQVDHPLLLSEQGNEEGEYVYFKYCWWDEGYFADKGKTMTVNGPRSTEEQELFSTAETDRELHRVWVKDNTIPITKVDHARTDHNYYLVEICGYIVKDGKPVRFYQSSNNFIQFGYSEDVATVRNYYALQVKVDEVRVITATADEHGKIDPEGTVTVPKGESKTFTITPDSGYYIKDVLVDGKSVGAVSTYTFENVEKNHEIHATFVRNHTPGHPTQPEQPKVEIPDEDALGLNTDDHFAYIIGYPDGTVQPNGQITRAEATTIFFRLLTEESRSANLTKTNGYTDVASDAWYNTAVSTMTKAGIVDGYPDGTFRPDAPITRAEMAKIISLFAKLDKSESRFSDIAGHWAEAYIRLAAGNGWIAGYPDGTFGPQRNITRAETATMINRVLDRVPSEESQLLSRGVMQIWPDANPGDWFYLAMQEATNSHDYERNAKWAAADEQWTALRETRDWKALEQ